jgi:adenylate cyclase
MVISGVPHSRTDHLQDPQGREVPLRIGLAAGSVVAGVVGARKFFHDVWGEVVNVASRMEATDVFEERGEIDVKGNGVMHTWYLTAHRPQ